MKHRIIIILSLLTMGFIPSLAEDTYCGVALLSHQGKQTAYAADNVQAAVDDYNTIVKNLVAKKQAEGAHIEFSDINSTIEISA